MGPYPADKLTYRGRNVVEFETPANTKGLGTNSKLLENASPTDGVAVIVGAATDLVEVSARIPAGNRDLIPVLARQVEVGVASEAE